MTRYWTIAGGIVAIFLTGYLLAEGFNIDIMTNPSLGQGIGGAVLGVSLLVADAVLPVASSLVMIALGALYGAGVGTLLALVGRVGMEVVGFWIGRHGGPILVRFVSPRARSRADRLLERWGALAIVFSRPVPLLSETIAILAGASPMGWTRLLLAATIGSLPEAAIYAIAGSTAATFQSAAVIWSALLFLAGIFWLVGIWLDKRA
jgi:uncharacterized membrane protein YdjX (TVP38/TMEM64 family)